MLCRGAKAMALPAVVCGQRFAVSLHSDLWKTLKVVSAPAVCTLRPLLSCPVGTTRFVDKHWTNGPCACVGRERDKRAEAQSEEGVENPAEEKDKNQVEGEETSVPAEVSKVLDDGESRALLEDLDAAAARVSSLQADLESHKQREQDIAELRAEIEQYAKQQAAADSLVAECRNEVADAEKSLRSASIALVTARAGSSSQEELPSKWQSPDVDENAERMQSGKAAGVSSLAGGLASLPFLLSERGVGVSTIIGLGGVLVSCSVFGVCYRYTVRRDLGNFELKCGAAAAFALVTGIAEMDTTQALVNFPDQGWNEVLKASLYAGESFVTFAFAAVSLDYCLREGFLEPFPSRRP